MLQRYYPVLIPIILLSFPIISYSQAITGKVFTSEEEPAQFVNVIALTQDSSLIKGNYYKNGEFLLQYLAHENCLVKISLLGYKPKYIPVKLDGKDTVNLGEIVLEPGILKLDEVKIKGKKIPMVEQNERGVVLNVNTTPLKNEESVSDVLAQAPGVIADNNGNIQVFGKGKPLINIDGKKTRSVDQLNMLTPNDIKNIEIIENPSSKYDAKYQSVININTVKGRQESYGLKLYDNLKYGKYLKNRSYINFSRQGKKLAHFISYEFKSGKKENIEKSNNSIFHPDTANFYNNFSADGFSKYKKHEYLYILDYKISDKHDMGLQYYGSAIEGSDNTRVNSLISQSHSTKNYINAFTRETSTLDNSVNLNYSYQHIETTKLNCMLDYTNYIIENTDNNAQVIESEKSENKVYGESIYDIVSAKIDFSSLLGDSLLEYSMGLKGSGTTNENNNVFQENTTGNFVIDPSLSYETKYSEQLGALYLNITKSFNKLSLTGGLRTEYYKQKVDQEDGIRRDTSVTGYFPYISLYYALQKYLRLKLSYAKKIKRPNYLATSEGLTYINEFMYREGNPVLEPTIYHNYDISIIYGGAISLGVGYNREENYYALGFYNQNNTIIAKSLNFDKENLFTRFNFFTRNKLFSTNTGFYLTKPFFNYTYRGEELSAYDYGYSINSYNIFYLKNNFEFYLKGSYSDLGEMIFYTFKPNYYTKVGIRKHFFNKALRLGVYGQISSDTKYVAEYRNIRIDHQYKTDNSFVQFTLRYFLKNYKNKNKQRTSQQEEKNRIN